MARAHAADGGMVELHLFWGWDLAKDIGREERIQVVRKQQPVSS